MEGPWRPEREPSPGVLWEPPIGEAAISFQPVFLSDPVPSDDRNDVGGDVWGTQVSFVPPQKKTIFGEGCSD